MDATQTLLTSITELARINQKLSSELATYKEEAKDVNEKVVNLYKHFISIEKEIANLTGKECKPNVVLDPIQALIETENIVGTSKDDSPDISFISSDSTIMMENLLFKVLDKHHAGYKFVKGLLSFKGTYLTGNVILKTLTNQQITDPSPYGDWLPVIATGGHYSAIEKYISENKFECVDTVEGGCRPDWIGKTYVKIGRPKYLVDMVVYYYKPFNPIQITKDELLHKSTFMLTFQYQHNFYDGTHFYVLDAKALRTKTHIISARERNYVSCVYEKFGFKNEVSEYKPIVSRTKKIHNALRFEDLAKHLE